MGPVYRILLLLAVALPLWGQGTVSGVSLIKRDRAWMLRYTISPVIANDGIRCSFDTDTVALDQRTATIHSKATNSGLRTCSFYGAAPATKYYVGPQTSDSTKTLWSSEFQCTGTCTNCGSGDNAFFADGSGLNCDAAGEFPNFTTDAEDTDPAPDPPVTSAQTTPPTITGTTSTVASDCSDFATKKNDAEANANAGNVSKLVMPTTGCGPFNLEAITAPGMVVVTSAADPKLLPPNGAMIDKTALPFLGKITFTTLGAWGYNDELITADDNARGYYFYNLAIEPPALDSSTLTPLTFAITGINTSTDTITVASTTGLSTGDSIEMVVANLEGTGVRGGYGPLQLCDVTATTFRLAAGGATKTNCGTIADLVGTYTSGGTVRRWIALPITGHTSSSGNHALTITSHGIANFPDMTITAGAGNTITVSGTPAEYQIGNTAESARTARVVHVEGTSVGTCDGLWQATVSGSNLTLARSGSTVVCDGVTTGTVHGHRAISVFQTSSDTIGDYEPRAFNFEVVDANTLELLETTAVASVSGGYIFWDVEPFGAVIELSKSDTSLSVEDVTFDRVVMRGCLPWWSQNGIQLGSTENVAIINSWLEGCAWRRVNPVNSIRERIHGYSQSHILIGLRQTKGLVLDNNYLWPSPEVFDDDDTGSTADDVSVDDLTVSRNYFWHPSWTHAALSDYRRHFFHRAFSAEHKALGPRSEHVGNYFFQNTSDFNSSQPTLEFSVQGSNSAFPNGPAHVRVEYNIFDAVTTSIAATLADGPSGTTGNNRRFNLFEKVRIANNLFSNIDTSTLSPGSNTGHLLIWTAPVLDLVFENNTSIPKRCVMCSLVWFGGHRSTGGRFINNVFLVNEGSASTRMGLRTESANDETPSSWTSSAEGLTLFEGYFRRGASTDSLSQWGGTGDENLHISGLESSSSGSYDSKAISTADADTISRNELENSVGRMSGLDTDNTTIGDATACAAGTCPDTLDTRLGLALQASSYQPVSPTYDGKGVDLTDLADEQGFPGTITVTADDNDATITLHTPATAGCYFDIAPFDTSWSGTWDTAGNVTRQLNADASQTQSEQFTSLTAETKYYYRVWGGPCRKLAIGEFTTAGTP